MKYFAVFVLSLRFSSNRGYRKRDSSLEMLSWIVIVSGIKNFCLGSLLSTFQVALILFPFFDVFSSFHLVSQCLKTNQSSKNDLSVGLVAIKELSKTSQSG